MTKIVTKIIADGKKTQKNSSNSLLLTIFLSTYTLGLADGYSRNNMLMATPIKMPISTPTAKQSRKVAKVGIKSFLLDLHMGFTTSYSIIKMTAHIITAARDAFGMNAKYGVRKLSAKSTINPEKFRVVKYVQKATNWSIAEI